MSFLNLFHPRHHLAITQSANKSYVCYLCEKMLTGATDGSPCATTLTHTPVSVASLIHYVRYHGSPRPLRSHKATVTRLPHRQDHQGEHGGDAA